MGNIVYQTSILSLIIQFLVAILNIYALMIKVPFKLIFIKQLLWIEFFVQTVEGFFYTWLFIYFNKIKNITTYRYYDWIITTPIMLFTYVMYLIYTNHYTKNINNIKTHNLLVETKKQLYPLFLIFILNWIMLLFGYLGEINKMPIQVSTFFGFIPFLIMVSIIYFKYANKTATGITSFYYFAPVWALYGFAALMKYDTKNAFYNIIDLFSKNLTGFLLSILLIYG